MHLHLVAVGKRMPAWVNAGYTEYAKRFTANFRLQLIEIEPAKRTKNSDITRVIQQEGEQILKAIPPNSRIIALHDRGQQWDTPTLAKQIEGWQLDGRDVSLLIGGPDGLAPDCLKKAELQWSLSKLTFPHPLVRIIVAEQLYRATSLLRGHPYHRE